MVLMINVLSNQAASSHVKRLVGERGDWEVEVERLRSTFSHQEEGWDFFCVGSVDQFNLHREQHKARSRELRDQCK